MGVSRAERKDSWREYQGAESKDSWRKTEVRRQKSGVSALRMMQERV
ncbi:MAG: hypothetical protein HFI60_01425 [Lachnospiraceae bacterium]|nr:hypothetical protein [Lachnospiraceae bacterium]